MIFNFGEVYYESGNFFYSLFLPFLTVILSFWGSFIIYKRKNRDDKRKEDKKRNEELSDILKYFKELLKEVSTTIAKQNEESNKFIELIIVNPYEINTLKLLASNEIERIISLDILKIYSAYRFKFLEDENWMDDLRSLYHILDFIDKHIKEIESIFKNYRKTTELKLIEFKIKEKFLYPFYNDITKKINDNLINLSFLFNCRDAKIILEDINLNSFETYDTVSESIKLLNDKIEKLNKIVNKLE